MNIFIKILLLLVVLAIAAPFVLKGPDGQPLMTLDDLHTPDVAIPEVVEKLPEVQNPFRGEEPSAGGKKSARTEIYSWKDAQGNVHYSNKPPATGIEAEKMVVDPNVNVLPLDKADESR